MVILLYSSDFYKWELLLQIKHTLLKIKVKKGGFRSEIEIA